MEITRALKEPKPSKDEQKALEYLLQGQGSPANAQAVRLLVDRCGRYGCVYTKPSKTSPGMKECPGWCEALELYDKQCALQASATSSDTKSKIGKLTRDERAAIQALENTQVSTKDVFVLTLLSERCAKSGCAQSSDFKESCPGWCEVARRAWDIWWAQ